MTRCERCGSDDIVYDDEMCGQRFGYCYDCNAEIVVDWPYDGEPEEDFLSEIQRERGIK